MRLPLSKVYRAFLQLDRFSDAECERFVLRATQDYPESKVGAHLVGAAIMIAIIAALVIPERIIWSVFSQRYTNVLSREHAEDLLIAASAWMYGVLFLLGMLIVRDRWLIRTITLRVHQTSCPGCGYSLLGLPIAHGVITCPECAAPFFLADHGMTPDDMISPRAKE